MFRLLFTNLGMLAGLAALAIPVVIHLLLRSRKRRLRFSTLQFFLRQDAQSTQRRRLRNLLLLSIRLLLLTLLVLAFARPFLPRDATGGGGRPGQQAVFVLDRSLSMRAADQGVSRWERNLEAVRQALSDMTAADRAALVGCGARAEVLSGLSASEAVLRVLKDVQPLNGTADLGEGLRLAGKLLSAAEAKSNPAIYVASDLQEDAVKNLPQHPVRQDVEVRVLRAADVVTPNVAILDLKLDPRETPKPFAVVANFSEEAFTGKNLVLSVDGKEVLSQPLSLETGAVQKVELALPAQPPGWHSAELRISADDALPIDNARYEVFQVPQPVRTLVVESRNGKRVFEEESYFLVSALVPSRGGTNSAPSPFTVEKVSLTEAVGKLGGLPEKPAYDLVILPGLKQLPPGLARALDQFVQGGGGLMLFLGDEINAGHYNQELGGMLPVSLGRLERNAGENFQQKWHLDEFDLAEDMFAVFRRPNSGNLFLPVFTQRFAVATNAGGWVAAKFEDGVAAIAHKKLGPGRVALVNTSADTAWTDWQKHKTFVPWLHGACRQLARRSSVDSSQPALRLVTADDVDLDLGATARQARLRLQRAGDKEIAVQADDLGRLTAVKLTEPGLYTVRSQEGRELRRLAVNPPAEESDLAALTPNEILHRLTRVPPPANRSLEAGLFGSGDHQKELWRLLLLAALGLMAAEVLLANRTYA